MAVAFRGRAEVSPGRTRVWAEQPRLPGKALVVYYLSRNGHLEHPHFMEVPFSSAQGLYLRDVVGRLSALRGPAMAGMHSWSSKRRYRNGFVWHDLSEDDLIHPVHGNEYVLKGTELLHIKSSSSCSSASSSAFSHASTASSSTSSERSLEVQTRARWSSSAVAEYKVYKAQTTATDATASSTDASTQTEEHRRHRRRAPPADKKLSPAVAELSIDEISPPPSSSSSEEMLAKARDGGGPVVAAAGPEDKDRAAGGCLSGRLRAPAMLMHLISCGSISVKANGFSLMPQYMGGLDRAESMGRMPSFRGLMRADDGVCFSGSMVETVKTASGGSGNGPEPLSLSRSSSYGADRSLKMDLAKEMEEVRARCMPRRPKARRERKAEK